MKLHYNITALLALLITFPAAAQIPILNSTPAITNKVLYLDFDGQVVKNTSWNSGGTITALPSTMSAANIILIFKRVAEDYIPFDVNVTTDSLRFNAAPANQRMRIIFTPTSAWYGSAGGVAYVGSFAWGGTPGTPCWVFENQLSYNAKNMGEAASHEAGHTLTLRHHSIWDASCAKTAEYNPGVGTGVTSWAPIMGVGYSKNVTIWHFGANTSSCTTIQFDHGSSTPGITSPGFLAFKPDDVGNTYNTGKILNLNTVTTIDSGMITQPSDIDLYRFTICNNRYVSINVKPWALDTINYGGANLDIKLKLYSAANNSLIAADSTLTRLNALRGLNLTAGNYYFVIDGDKSSYAPDYGSLGRYYMSIKATNPPALSNTIVLPSSICTSQSVTLSYSSNGTPTIFNWTVSGASTFTSASANPVYTFPVAGSYTVHMLGVSGPSQSCVVTKTVSIASLPNVALSGKGTQVCYPTAVTLTASGANSYTWMPGNHNGSLQVFSPSVTTIYTLTGSNGSCQNKATYTQSVGPLFTASLASSAGAICPGKEATLTASGAGVYTLQPGSVSGSTFAVAPLSTTVYTLTGSLGGCQKQATRSIIVYPGYTMVASYSNLTPCIGDSVVFSMTGTSNYTVQPGNLTGANVTVFPTSYITYSISSADQYGCRQDTVFTVTPLDCNLAGINESASRMFRVFPNPAEDVLHIDGLQSGTLIRISDLTGRIVFQGLAETNETLIPLTFPGGMYIITAGAYPHLQSQVRLLVK